MLSIRLEEQELGAEEGLRKNGVGGLTADDPPDVEERAIVERVPRGRGGLGKGRRELAAGAGARSDGGVVVGGGQEETSRELAIREPQQVTKACCVDWGERFGVGAGGGLGGEP